MTVWSYSQKMTEKEGCLNCRRLLDRMKSEKSLFNRKLKVVEILKDFLSEKHNFFLSAKKKELADVKMKCQNEKAEIRQHLLSTIERCEVYYEDLNDKKLRLNKALKDVANYKFLSEQSFARAKELEIENKQLTYQLNAAKTNKKKGKKNKKGKDLDVDWLETLSVREPLGSPDEGLGFSDGLSSLGSPFDSTYESAKLPSQPSHCEECIKIINDRHICGKGSEEGDLAPLFLTPSLQPLRASTPLKELSTSVDDYADENDPESATKRRRRGKNKSETVKNDTIFKGNVEDSKSTLPLKKIQSSLPSSNYESNEYDENEEPAVVQNKKSFIHSSKNNKNVVSGTSIVEREQTENSTQASANIDMPSIFEDFDTLIEKKLLEASTSFDNSDDFNFDSLEDSVISNKMEGSALSSTKNKNNIKSSQQIVKIQTPKVDEVSSRTSTNTTITQNKPENVLDTLWEKSPNSSDKVESLSDILDILNNKKDLFLDGELGDLPEKSPLPDFNEHPVKNKRISRIIDKNKTLENPATVSEQADLFGPDLNLSSDDDIEYPDKVINKKINQAAKSPLISEPSTKMSIFDLDGDEPPLAFSREMSPVSFEKNDVEHEILTHSSPKEMLIPDILSQVKEKVMKNIEFVSPLKPDEKLQSDSDDYLNILGEDNLSKNLSKFDASNEDVKEQNSEIFDRYLDEIPLSLRLDFDCDFDALPLSLRLELSEFETKNDEKFNNYYEKLQTSITEVGKTEFSDLKSNKKFQILSSKQKADMRTLSRKSKSKKHCKSRSMKKTCLGTLVGKNIKSLPVIELEDKFVQEDFMLQDSNPDNHIVSLPQETYDSSCDKAFVGFKDKKHIKTSSKQPSVSEIPETPVKPVAMIELEENKGDDKLHTILEEMLCMPSLLSPLSQDVNVENNGVSSSKQRTSQPEILITKPLVDYSSDSSDSDSCLSHSAQSEIIKDQSIKMNEAVVEKPVKNDYKTSPIKSCLKDKLSPIKEIFSPSKDTSATIISSHEVKEEISRVASPEFKSPKSLAPKLKKSKKRETSSTRQLKKTENRFGLRSSNSPLKQTSEVSLDTDDDFLLFVDGLKQNYEALSPLAGDVIESDANSSLDESEIKVDESNLTVDSVQKETSCINNVPPDSRIIANEVLSESNEHLGKTGDTEVINNVTLKDILQEEVLCDDESLVKTELPETNEEDSDDTHLLLDTSNELEMDSEGSNDGYYICLTHSNDEENLNAFVLKMSGQVGAETKLNSNSCKNLSFNKTPKSDFIQADDRVVLLDNENTSDETYANMESIPCGINIGNKMDNIALQITPKSKELIMNEHVSEITENADVTSLAKSGVFGVELLESPLSPDVPNHSEELESTNDLSMTNIPIILNRQTTVNEIPQNLEETKDSNRFSDSECLELTKSENQKCYSKKKAKSWKTQCKVTPGKLSFSRLRQFQLCKKSKKSENIDIYFEDVCLPSTMEDLMYLSSRNLFDTKDNNGVKNILDSLRNIPDINDDVEIHLFEDLDFDSECERNIFEESRWKDEGGGTDGTNSTLNNTIESFTFDTSENTLDKSNSSIIDIGNNADNSFDEDLIICKDKSSLTAINGNLETEEIKMFSGSLPFNVCDLKPESIKDEDCLSENLIIDESQFADYKKQKSDELLLDIYSPTKMRKVDYSAGDHCSKILDSKPLYLNSDATILNNNKDFSLSVDKGCSDEYKDVPRGINMLASHRNMTCFGKLVSLQYSGKAKARVSNYYSGYPSIRSNNYTSFGNNINYVQSLNYSDKIKEDVLDEFRTTGDHVKEGFENLSPRKLVKIEAGECKNNTCLSNPAVSFSNENSILVEKNNETFETTKYLKFNFYTEASETEMQSEPCFISTSISDSNVIKQEEEGILNEEPSRLKFSETWNIRPQVKSPRLEADMILCKTSAFECSLDYWHDYARLNPKPRPVNLITEKDLQSLEGYIKEIMKANNEDNLHEKIQNISLKIEHMDSGHIADMIVDAVFTDNGEADLRFTPPAPPLTPIQRRLLLLVSFLAKGREEYYITVLKACEEPVVSFVDKCSVDKLCNLVQFHTAMCKHLGFLSRSRAFLYDILYCKGHKVYPLVYSMLPLWIEILPTSQESQDCLLTQTIVYLLTHFVANEKPDTIPYHNSLKQFLEDAYEYGKPMVTRDTLCNKLIENIRVPGAGLALVLLCKREEWDWASKTMESKLHPIILSWIQDQVDEDTAIQAVLCLGRVVRGYPINVASNSIKRSRDLLESVLKHQKNIDVTEAAVNSICMLRRHDLFSCSVIFTKWRPAEGKITKNMADNIKTVLSAKQLPYWKKFLTRYN